MVYPLSYFWLIDDIARVTLEHPEKGLKKKHRVSGQGQQGCGVGKNLTLK